MKRSIRGLLLLPSAAVLLTGGGLAPAQGQNWGTLKGKVVWAGEMPKPKPINVTQDQAHCLANGPLMDEELVVNPKNKGVKWVFVWLAPASGDVTAPVEPIHPDLKKAKGDLELDQPQCMFIPRAVALRQGQNLVVKNSAPVLHNIKWTGNPDINPGGSVAIPAGKAQVIKDLQPQKLPLILECNIHPWMRGRLAVFSHPYYAITDADGNFEIPNAPAGKFRLFVYQESIGWRNGAKGAKGESIEVKAGANDLGTLDLK